MNSIENLHGALPVREAGFENSSSPSRRLALAIWYVTSDDPQQESVPEYGQKSSTNEGKTKEEADPNRSLLFKIPVESI